MKLIVGLGNPGAEYAGTRHNAGFMAVDALVARHAPGAVWRSRFGGLAQELLLPGRSPAAYDAARASWPAPSGPVVKALVLKPMSYMNLSGRAVVEAARFYKLMAAEDVLILVDDVALPVGAIKLKGSGSAGGHNGLADIERALGSAVYARCRIGIDAPGRVPQREYVLQKFSPDQRDPVERACSRAADAAELWASAGVIGAMNIFNVRDRAEEAGPEPAAAAAPSASTTPAMPERKGSESDA